MDFTGFVHSILFCFVPYLLCVLVPLVFRIIVSNSNPGALVHSVFKNAEIFPLVPNTISNKGLKFKYYFT